MSKFNWGHGIFLFFVVFVGTLITVLVASRRVDHSLVVDDYYAQDLAYQSTYNKAKNSLEDRDLLDIKTSAHNVVFDFNSEDPIEGNIHFYRPSNKKMDFTIQIDNKHKLEVDRSKIQKGKWKIKVDWTIGNKSYYKEEELYL